MLHSIVQLEKPSFGTKRNQNKMYNPKLAAMQNVPLYAKSNRTKTKTKNKRITLTLLALIELLAHAFLSLLPFPVAPRSTSHMRAVYGLRVARVCNNSRRNEKSGKLYPLRLPLLLFEFPLPLLMFRLPFTVAPSQNAHTPFSSSVVVE